MKIENDCLVPGFLDEFDYEIVEPVTAIRESKAGGEGKYRTIVVDPPWDMPDTGNRTKSRSDEAGTYESTSGRVVKGEWWARFEGKNTKIPYATMSVEAIKALPVSDLAAKDAHLYLWTTNRYLVDAYDVARAWGFKPSQLVTWCKPPMGKGHGGAFVSTTEFLLSCRRGSLRNQSRVDSSWFKFSRVYENGHIKHSAKPEGFLDLIEQVSPDPYLEIFARRNRLGWDTWGNEALNHVEVS